MKLNYVINNTPHTVDFWVNNIVGGYAIEFAIDCTQLYSFIEMDFFKGPHDIFLKELGT
jgi:hypothetical protein